MCYHPEMQLQSRRGQLAQHILSSESLLPPRRGSKRGLKSESLAGGGGIRRLWQVRPQRSWWRWRPRSRCPGQGRRAEAARAMPQGACLLPAVGLNL